MSSMPATFTPARWDLTELVPSVDQDEIVKATEALLARADTFADNEQRLAEDISSEDFVRIIRDYEDITSQSRSLHSYAILRVDEDNQNSDYQDFLSQLDEFATNIENKVSFFNFWWSNLGDNAASRLLTHAGEYKQWLLELRRYKPHILDPNVEIAINLKESTGNTGLQTVYDLITNSYRFDVEVGGENKSLTHVELQAYFRHHDPVMRERAYQAYYKRYKQDANVLGYIYQTLVADWYNIQLDLRGFSTPIAVRNFINNIPDDVIEALLQACQENRSVFQRFLKEKARRLGVEQLRRYDIYAPLSNSQKTVEFPVAVEKVLAIFAAFDPTFADLARRMFVEKRIDSEIRPGKRRLGFCMTVNPKTPPWVLVNYQGGMKDVATLSHELGHAVHYMLAGSENTVLTIEPSTPLAETASIFSEMLVLDHITSELDDPSEKVAMIASQIDSFLANIQRNAYIVLFERDAYPMIQEGASISDLAAAYKANLEHQYEGALDVAPEFQWEWLALPPIYKEPFSTYAYSFGQLLALSLYQQYKEEGQPFIDRYYQILSAGGSDSPVAILKRAGIAVDDPGFWAQGYRFIDRLVGDLEAMPL